MATASESLEVESAPHSVSAVNRGRMAVLLVPVSEGTEPGAHALDLTQMQGLESLFRLSPVQVPQAHPEVVPPSAPAHQPGGDSAAARRGARTDLADLKREVARLPRHHPLRVALQDEPDQMPRAELVAKAREWVKYLGWKDSP